MSTLSRFEMVRALVRQGADPANAERLVEAVSESRPPADTQLVTEHDEQCELFAWAKREAYRYPELDLMYAIPNFHGRLGRLTAKHGAVLKAEGRKRGVPDIFLPVARGGFHGLYLEMKSRKGSPTDDQIDWRDKLRAQGYCAEIVRGWHAARDLIVRYLDS